MFNDLYIKIPEDFEEQYLLYKQRLLGLAKIDKDTKDGVYTKDLKGILKIKKQEYELGDAKNMPFKLVSTLFHFGIEKRVDTIINETDEASKKNMNLTYINKKEILINRFKEVQRILNKQKPKIKLTLKFKDVSQTAYIDIS